jgi:hypothetical protein
MRYQVRGTITIEIDGWVEADSEAEAEVQLRTEIESVTPKEMYPGEIGCGTDEIPEGSLTICDEYFTFTPQVEVVIHV